MRTSEAVAAMPCPVCKTALALSDREGIEIDYCPSCRGVWLDRGELDKIIDRGAREPMPDREGGIDKLAARLIRGRAGGERHPHRKRKKSFLSELFD